MIKKYRKKYWGGEDLNKNVEEPSLGSNLEKTANIGIQVANNQVSSLLNNVAEKLNVDPNASTEVIVEQVNERLSQINEAFQSPEGQEMLKELGELTGQILQTSVEPLKKGQQILNQMLVEQMRSFEKIAWGAVGLVPVIGDVSEIIRLAKDLFQVFLKTMRSVTSVSLITSDMFEDISNTIGQKANLFTRMAKLIKKSISEGIEEGNRNVNNVLNMASNNLKEQANYLKKQEKEIAKNLENSIKSNTSSIQKGGIKISKRTNKSINRFLSSKVTASKIRKKYTLKKVKKMRKSRNRK